jgi:hypothetical protein
MSKKKFNFSLIKNMLAFRWLAALSTRWRPI